MIDLLLCDDSAEARASLRALVADHRGLRILGEATSGEEAVVRAAELAPDVVLIGAGLAEGADATRRIARLLPSVRVVTVAGADADSIEQMLAGARSCRCPPR